MAVSVRRCRRSRRVASGGGCKARGNCLVVCCHQRLGGGDLDMAGARPNQRMRDRPGRTGKGRRSLPVTMWAGWWARLGGERVVVAHRAKNGPSRAGSSHSRQSSFEQSAQLGTFCTRAKRMAWLGLARMKAQAGSRSLASQVFERNPEIRGRLGL